MAGFAFESKQTENTPVTRIESGAFSVRFAYSLSYERITGNRPSNDYLEWNASGSTLVFALCDGKARPVWTEWVPEGMKTLDEIRTVTWLMTEQFAYDNMVKARDFYLLNLGK